MSHNIIYNLGFINVLKGMGKDEQSLLSITIVYNINKEGLFTIEYWFAEIDFDIWLKILKTHKQDLYEYFLYDINNQLLEKPKKSKYNYYRLESNDENLHVWIDYIPFLEKDNWNNMNESLMKNTNKR